MDTLLDLLWLRIPPIRYVCPPVCEVAFSGSGSSTIILEQHPTLTPVQNPTIEGSLLCWVEYPGAICYTVYRSEIDSDTFEIVSECNPDTCYEFIGEGCFRVSAITPEGETPTSKVVCTGDNIDPVVSDWVRRVRGLGSDVTIDTENKVNDFIVTLKRDGIFSLIQRMNIFAGNDLVAVRAPLINTVGDVTDSLSGFVSGDYSESTGLSGNALGKWMNTGYIPSTHATGNNFSFGANLRARNANFGIQIGSESVTTGANRCALEAVFLNNLSPIVFGGTQNNAPDTDAVLGFWLATENASNMKLYKNGTEILSAVASSGALPNQDMSVFGYHGLGGSTDNQFDGILSNYVIGLAFDATQQASLNTAIHALEVALGRNVV